MKTFEVDIGLDDVIENDMEGFLDMIAEKTGNPLLMDISYRVVRANPDGTLRLEVCGDDSMRGQNV